MFRADLEGVEQLQGMMIGVVSVVVGVGLAAATTFGVVKSQTSGSFEPKGSVLEYGATE